EPVGVDVDAPPLVARDPVHLGALDRYERIEGVRKVGQVARGISVSCGDGRADEPQLRGRQLLKVQCHCAAGNRPARASAGANALMDTGTAAPAGRSVGRIRERTTGTAGSTPTCSAAWAHTSIAAFHRSAVLWRTT